MKSKTLSIIAILMLVSASLYAAIYVNGDSGPRSSGGGGGPESDPIYHGEKSQFVTVVSSNQLYIIGPDYGWSDGERIRNGTAPTNSEEWELSGGWSIENNYFHITYADGDLWQWFPYEFQAGGSYTLHWQGIGGQAGVLSFGEIDSSRNPTFLRSWTNYFSPSQPRTVSWVSSGGSSGIVFRFTRSYYYGGVNFSGISITGPVWGVIGDTNYPYLSTTPSVIDSFFGAYTKSGSSTGITPASSSAYSLGNSDKAWKDITLGNASSLNFGPTKLTAGSRGLVQAYTEWIADYSTANLWLGDLSYTNPYAYPSAPWSIFPTNEPPTYGVGGIYASALTMWVTIPTSDTPYILVLSNVYSVCTCPSFQYLDSQTNGHTFGSWGWMGSSNRVEFFFENRTGEDYIGLHINPGKCGCGPDHQAFQFETPQLYKTVRITNTLLLAEPVENDPVWLTDKPNYLTIDACNTLLLVLTNYMTNGQTVTESDPAFFNALTNGGFIMGGQGVNSPLILTERGYIQIFTNMAASDDNYLYFGAGTPYAPYPNLKEVYEFGLAGGAGFWGWIIGQDGEVVGGTNVIQFLNEADPERTTELYLGQITKLFFGGSILATKSNLQDIGSADKPFSSVIAKYYVGNHVIIGDVFTNGNGTMLEIVDSESRARMFGDFVPDADDSYELGASNKQWKILHVTGSKTITNSWTDAIGVTNEQVFVRGLLNSWKKDGIEQ